MGDLARRFAQICKDADDVWKQHFGEHHADAEPEQQGNDAEQRSGENAGLGMFTSLKNKVCFWIQGISSILDEYLTPN
jgi:hypothetical protein